MKREPLLVVNVSVDPGLGLGKGLAVPDRLLAELLDFCYRHRRKKPAVLDLMVAGDIVMTRLNRRHLSHDGPTDVLAFADGEDEDSRLRLGDIAIGGAVAEREAAARDIPFEHELAFYALHGLLHLLGMDDESDADRAAMHKIQWESMRGFGLPVSDALRQW